ncbi:MAG: methyltransferase domain-containing protein [Methanomassiliicoccales archaeon]|nr:methyltransferase domain-containing protein [Methanomassiliicoccales archaeon]
MPHATVLFELSGEHPTLPRAEVLACLGAESTGFREKESGQGFLVAECDQGSVSTIAGRLALTHRLGRYLGSAHLEDLEKAVPDLQLPEGTLCVRAKTVEGLHPEVDTFGLAKKVGYLLAADHRIDLSSPDIRLRLLLSDRIHFFIEDREIDRKQFEKRKVAERPFFSPISLHPRYARALVNLTGARKGDVLLDPFCGTGGIVLEAALLGLKAVGSDIDPEMVEGCQRNLEHFGVHDVRVEVSDVGDIESNFAPVEAVATDPPYGRAASTKKEDIDKLYFRGLQAMTGTVVCGGRIGVVLPRPIEATGLQLMQKHEQRVHRSLTRHYHLFIRP